jgi:hypothetical protein
MIELNNYIYQDETELQEIIFENPSILCGMESLELFNASTIISCREFKVGSGFIDLLFVTDRADIVLVETKLIKNPEASRVVIAQTIDYLKSLVKMDADDFLEQLATMEMKHINEQAIKDGSFVSQLQLNLSRGNVSILIVGDDINPNLLGMVASIQSAPHLAFTIYLIRLQSFIDADAHYLLPTVISRTNEIERSVINITVDLISGKKSIESKSPEKLGKGNKPILSWEQFLNNCKSSEIASALQGFREQWIEIEESGINMGTVGFSSGIIIDERRIPIQFVYDRFLELVSDRQRKAYSISDEAYACYTETISEVPRIYDSKLISNKVRVGFNEVTTDELKILLSASIKLAKYLKSDEQKY